MSEFETNTKLDLERIVFIGRTFEEYMDMFSLSTEELKGKTILDCPAGACSFTALGNKLGLNVTASDIAYEHAMIHMEKAKDNYVWDYVKDIDALRKCRLNALNELNT